MSPSVDPSMSLHPSSMITQQMGQLSLGNTGAVSGILGHLGSHTAMHVKLEGPSNIHTYTDPNERNDYNFSQGTVVFLMYLDLD